MILNLTCWQNSAACGWKSGSGVCVCEFEFEILRRRICVGVSGSCAWCGLVALKFQADFDCGSQVQDQNGTHVCAWIYGFGEGGKGAHLTLHSSSAAKLRNDFL